VRISVCFCRSAWITSHRSFFSTCGGQGWEGRWRGEGTKSRLQPAERLGLHEGAAENHNKMAAQVFGYGCMRDAERGGSGRWLQQMSLLAAHTSAQMSHP
jgi:hypothetical protein